MRATLNGPIFLTTFNCVWASLHFYEFFFTVYFYFIQSIHIFILRFRIHFSTSLKFLSIDL